MRFPGVTSVRFQAGEGLNRLVINSQIERFVLIVHHAHAILREKFFERVRRKVIVFDESAQLFLAQRMNFQRSQQRAERVG